MWDVVGGVVAIAAIVAGVWHHFELRKAHAALVIEHAALVAERDELAAKLAALAPPKYGKLPYPRLGMPSDGRYGGHTDS